MNVIVYSQQSCGHCQRQKAFLERQGVDFIEKDINQSKENRDEFLALEGRGTPLTVVKDGEKVITTITGFNQQQLVQILEM
ncbi:glutaredoxin family protein [Gracilibacillus caseinilyticus]|uniref:Glutaredoxin family protein n=1 Tax=Gracilibacillus caseinilyticus TaxID=2932256 RepID=A0ABY4EZH5_9BACI|nr:glutaredoxin family protein [Gracilibacillus caseinilyticus]UOQ49411.1 glutaredoxin family protein [Gracilibacillus caseinilyticus]